jgi:antitoxin (DNA-binding transcriptional repressor) of toxin-antitoxin stability system
MQTTLNVREFRNIMPRLREALHGSNSFVITSHGKPIARVLPPIDDVVELPCITSLAAFRASLGRELPDSTSDIRAERDKR